MDIAAFTGYELHAPKPANSLAFIAFFLLILTVTLIYKFGGKGFRDFIAGTFTDKNGKPNAGKLTAFTIMMLIIWLCIQGGLFNRWMPEFVLQGLLTAMVVLLGFSSSIATVFDSLARLRAATVKPPEITSVVVPQQELEVIPQPDKNESENG